MLLIKVGEVHISNMADGGEGEIRTHGTLRYDGFQDRCIQPGSATSPFSNLV